jgi:predicted SprT family Zn-dependent metalloprotease
MIASMDIDHEEPSNIDEHGSSNITDRHVCHCGKSFIRKEHLKRHQATHGERAFLCDQCQQSFTRK